MIELFDNLSQLMAVALGYALSTVQYLHSRRTPWFLLSCFYGCFGLGLIYWLLYTSLVPDASPMFYVSDIGWISCFLFLLVLQVGFAERGEEGIEIGRDEAGAHAGEGEEEKVQIAPSHAERGHQERRSDADKDVFDVGHAATAFRTAG